MRALRIVTTIHAALSMVACSTTSAVSFSAVDYQSAENDIVWSTYEIQPLLPPVAAEDYLPIVSVRQEDTIEDLIREAGRAESWASDLKQDAMQLKRALNSEVDLKKNEKETLKARIKLAKEREEEVEKERLEQELELIEADQKRLEQRRDMRGKEENLAGAMKDEARSLKRLLEHELDVRRILDEIAELKEGDLEVQDIDKLTRLMRDGGRAESRYLESLTEYFKKRKEKVEKSRDTIEQRMELLKMQGQADKLR